MHEIGTLYEAVKTVERVAKENDIEKVAYISLEIGELTGLLPVFFEKYYSVVTLDKPMFKNSELKIKVIPGEALCNNCHSLFNVMKNEGCCPKCSSRDKLILGGQDFIIKEIASLEE